MLKIDLNSWDKSLKMMMIQSLLHHVNIKLKSLIAPSPVNLRRNVGELSCESRPKGHAQVLLQCVDINNTWHEPSKYPCLVHSELL